MSVSQSDYFVIIGRSATYGYFFFVNLNNKLNEWERSSYQAFAFASFDSANKVLVSMRERIAYRDPETLSPNLHKRLEEAKVVTLSEAYLSLVGDQEIRHVQYEGGTLKW